MPHALVDASQPLGWFWNLVSETEASLQESFTLEDEGDESVFDSDNRTKVSPEEFANGGKYRSVVKILMRYKGQDDTDKRWAMGSGWLVNKDTFITAGHCVYDWAGDGRGFGPVTEMKVYIGYCGKESVTEQLKDPSGIPQVQARRAIKVITTHGWLSSANNRNRDVAFVQVDKPFDGDLRNFSFEATPTSGHGVVGVVGYPGDKYLGSGSNMEKGAEMYEMFDGVDYNLKSPENPLHMLQYRISTFAGQSGSPVVLKGTGDNRTVSIGTHVYGGRGLNSASPIDSPFGVDYQTFINAFDKGKSNPFIVEFKGKLPASPDGKGSDGESEFVDPPNVPPEKHDTEEDFWDVLQGVGRVVAGVGQVALPLVTPLLGPLAGPASAIGGVALGALGKACAESDFETVSNSKPNISISQKDLISDGAINRAVLAEAALQTVLRLERGPTSEKILTHMQKQYRESATSIKNLAPKLVPCVTQASLALAVDADMLAKSKTAAQVTAKKAIGRGSGSEASLSGPGADFIATATDTKAKVYEGCEGFFDSFGDILKKGIEFGKPMLVEGARAGLKQLDKYLASQNKAESGFEEPDQADAQAAHLLAKRAVMAECALQAVLGVPTDELKNSVIPGDLTNGVAPEGFFDSFIGAAQSIGSSIVKVAPAVLKSAIPVLLDSILPK